MMTKRNCKRSTKVRILTLIPASVVLFLAISCFNGFSATRPMALKQTGLFAIVNQKQVFAITWLDTAKKEKTTVKKKVKESKGSTNTKETWIEDKAKTNGNNKVLYVLDGKKVDNLDKVNPDSLAEVNVLKDDNVIIARTRNGIHDAFPIEMTKKPLIIIDGIRQSKKIPTYDLPIFPPSIESISVLKGEAAKALYPDDWENGVLVITTKK